MAPTREQVRERDLGACIRCSTARDLQVHHRRLRSQGGRDTFANMITLCAACHKWVHDHPLAAQEEGWLLQAGFGPEATPVTHRAYPAGKIWLADDGTVALQWESRTTPPSAPDRPTPSRQKQRESRPAPAHWEPAGSPSGL